MEIIPIHRNSIRRRYKAVTPLVLFFSAYNCQDEQYDHLDEADVTKVDKLTNEAMIWMNSAMNQQSKQSLSVDPSVKVKDIQAKTKVSNGFLKHCNTEINR